MRPRMPNADASRWIPFRKPQRGARLRLFCLPYAGGGASLFRTWQARLPAGIEVAPVQLPGRENRLTEPPFRQWGPLLAALSRELGSWLDLPFAFFGHSLGSLVAFEAARKIRDEHGPEPVCFLPSAHRAPGAASEWKSLYKLPDEELRKELHNLAGTPAEVLEHDELMELMMPLLRADFELNGTYAEALPGAPLSCPVTALGGVADPDVLRHHLEAWGVVTRGRFRVRTLPGGHFFLHEHPESLLQAVAEELLPLV